MKKEGSFSKNILFNFFVVSFLFGVFLNNVFLSIFSCSLAFLFFLIIFLNFFNYYRKSLIVFPFIWIWFFCWVATSFFHISGVFYKEDLISRYFDNKNYNLVFEIKDVSKIEDFSIHYLANLKRIEEINLEKKIFATLIIPSNIKLEKWSIVKTKSKLFEIENFEGFDYKNYLLSKNIFFKSYIYNFDLIDSKEINSFEKNIRKIRQLFLSVIKKIYPEEEWIFLWWILIWARESLPKTLKEHFNNSWLTHFIAVSGFNITILIIFFTYIFKYFPVLIRVILITFFIITFTILVWYTAPVIRASIMWIIWYYILSSGRQGSSLSTILLTSLIMVAFSPLSLNYDVSLHLSFLAVIWIVYTQDFFKKIFHFLPETLAIKEAFVLTLASLSFTLPIMIFNFGQLSIMSPIANVLVTWTIPIAMLLGFLSIVFYFIYPFSWYLVWYLTWVFLKWDIMIVHLFWQMEWSILRVDFGILKNYLEVLFFVILVFLVCYFRKR